MVIHFSSLVYLKLNNLLIHLDQPLVTDLLQNEEKHIGYHDHLVILMLCEKAGKINKKENFLNRAWPEKHVSEGSLTQLISAIRTLIECNGKQQKYLKMVAKVGYKLESEAVSCIFMFMLIISGHPRANILSLVTFISKRLKSYPLSKMGCSLLR